MFKKVNDPEIDREVIEWELDEDTSYPELDFN